MVFTGWQANTTGEDVVAHLEKFDAFNVNATKAGPEQEYPEFTWENAVDCDADMLNIVAQMLWYNNRTDEQISCVIEKFRSLLVEYPGK